MTDPHLVDDRLRTERNLWLATVRDDGRPHIAPVWFVFVRSRFWIGTGRDSVKTRNAERNPCASVALEDGDQPIVAEGVVTVHVEVRPTDVVEAFRSKYDWDITVAEDPDIGTIVLWEIEPTRWLFGRPGT
jgi:PPOX class probable F420-dependent enzyme